MLFNQYVISTVKKFLGFVVSKFFPLKWYLRNKITIFTFHEVSNNPSKFCLDFDLAVSTEVFRAQVEWIKDNFNIINPRELDNSGDVSGHNFPKSAAMITFDDGFLGAFENALPILERMNIKAIIFLNMENVIEKNNMLPAKCEYLLSKCDNFKYFVNKNNIKYPVYLNINPSIMDDYHSAFGDEFKQEINIYQGALVDLSTLKIWNKKNVYYGNHLYQHWNAPALSEGELVYQFKKNKYFLDKLPNSLNLFAFTYGKPITCWTLRDVGILTKLGVNRLFTTHQGVNRDVGSLLLGRVSLPTHTASSNSMWFSIIRTIVRQ